MRESSNHYRLVILFAAVFMLTAAAAAQQAAPASQPASSVIITPGKSVAQEAPAAPAAVVPGAAQPAASAATSQPAAAAAACPPTSSEFEKKFKAAKNPTDWLKLGADFRARENYDNNIATLDHDAPAHERHYQRYRTRVWSSITPVKDISINSRLTWEFFNYCAPSFDSNTATNLRDTDINEAVLDTLNVEWRNVFGLPTKAVIGRQDILLGNGWLVLDGTPLDGSRTSFFDAVRLTTEAKDIQTTFDAIYLNQGTETDRWLQAFNDRNRLLTEQNEQGAILYATNKTLKNTEISPYFIYKNDDNDEDIPRAQQGDIYAPGARIAGDIDANWKYRSEAVYEFGHLDGRDLSAWGWNNRLEYNFNDKYCNQLNAAYEYLSGDDPGSYKNTQFDPLWGRWPQWSELLGTTWAQETRPFYWTNLQRVGPGWSFKPTAKTEVLNNYYVLFANDNTVGGQRIFSDNGLFRGQFLSFLLKYKHNDILSSHVLAEFFFPGNYYVEGHRQPALFLRYEIVLTW